MRSPAIVSGAGAAVIGPSGAIFPPKAMADAIRPDAARLMRPSATIGSNIAADNDNAPGGQNISNLFAGPVNRTGQDNRFRDFRASIKRLFIYRQTTVNHIDHEQLQGDFYVVMNFSGAANGLFFIDLLQQIQITNLVHFARSTFQPNCQMRALGIHQE